MWASDGQALSGGSPWDRGSQGIQELPSKGLQPGWGDGPDATGQSTVDSVWKVRVEATYINCSYDAPSYPSLHWRFPAIAQMRK